MKQKLIAVFVSITLSILVASCGKEPIADFSWEPEQPKAGEEVKFTNLSTDAKSYSWNFGDMSIGSETNPIHVYKKTGTFIVDLRAHNGLLSNEKTVTITVTD